MEREWWLWRKRERRERRFGGADLDGERERERSTEKEARPSTRTSPFLVNDNTATDLQPDLQLGPFVLCFLRRFPVYL